MIWKKLGKRFKMMLLIESNRLVPVLRRLTTWKLRNGSLKVLISTLIWCSLLEVLLNLFVVDAWDNSYNVYPVSKIHQVQSKCDTSLLHWEKSRF